MKSLIEIANSFVAISLIYCNSIKILVMTHLLGLAPIGSIGG